MGGSSSSLLAGAACVESAAAPAGARFAIARPALVLLQSLSLDVALGVLCAGAFAASAAGVDPPAAWWILLPLLTWTVYSADHLLDARRPGPVPHDPRHRFYHRHHDRLLPLTLVAASVGAVGAAVWLPGRSLAVGALVALAALAHLLTARRGGRRAKELTAAIVYTAGIWFLPLMSIRDGGGHVWLLALAHLLAAAANLIAFSIFELPIHALDDQPSIARDRGPAAARCWLRRLTLAGVAVAAWVLVVGPPGLALHSCVLLLLVALPGVMVRHPKTFGRGGRYRTFGDLSFLLMVLPWLLG